MTARAHTREGRLLETKFVPASAVEALVARHHAHGDRVHAANMAFRETALELSQWLGPEGSSAILARALNRAGQVHPALRSLKVVTNSAPVLKGLDACVAAEGADKVGAALESTLVELFLLLERLVGQDLARKLAERIGARNATDAQPTGEEPT